ncbi:MAG: discoidin domain-containing protein [Bryobacteraceae bacterium]|jgi:hypothetical protein
MLTPAARLRNLARAPACACLLAFAVAAGAGEHVIRIDTSHPLRTFDPARALGAAIDGHEQGDVLRMLSPANARAMRSAGFRALSYRLRTELAGEVWHWNPRGQWSDARRQQGYWVSDARSPQPILLSYGYRLPRRGNTRDQANDDGYSRIDDGDPATFWKSNPYLEPRFTHEPATAHPQWIVIDTGGAAVNEIHIQWGVPWALDYRVEFTNDTGDPEDFQNPGLWHPFPRQPAAGAGGTTTLRLSDTPMPAKYVRVLMTRSSATAPPGSTDIRDALGYAVREIGLGAVDKSGRYRELLAHGASRDTQSAIWVSSTDPWHRATDRDDGVEQPGFDLLARRSLWGSTPAMVPVGLLYDTPENAATEVEFLRNRGYPVGRVELGEEPEEQYGAAEDYGALYLEWADLLRQGDPALPLGGPSMVADSLTPDPHEHSRYLGRFLDYLRARGRLSDFRFFSFEWYPFDDVCAPAPPQLRAAAGLLAGTVQRFRGEGLPADLPILISEYGWSAYGARAEVDMEGALLNAEIAAQFLALGGEQCFLYGWEPNELLHERSCAWGNNMLLQMTGPATIPMATWHAARLITGRWLLPAGVHQLLPAVSDLASVASYAVRRPDGSVAVLLLNKDAEHDYSLRLPLTAATLYQFSGRQYRWVAKGAGGHPSRSLPPETRPLADGAAFTVAPLSITVVAGRSP